jgi:hypothetical protein
MGDTPDQPDRIEIERPEVPQRQERTLAERLRARQRQMASGEREPLDLDVPGYGEDLVIRYKYDPDAWDKFKKIARKVDKSKNPRKELIAHIDTLIFACDEILGRESGKLVPLHKIYPDVIPEGEPVVFDENLAAALDIDLPERPRARDVVMGLFQNPLAITAQHNEVAEWLQGQREDDGDEFAGE